MPITRPGVRPSDYFKKNAFAADVKNVRREKLKPERPSDPRAGVRENTAHRDSARKTVSRDGEPRQTAAEAAAERAKLERMLAEEKLRRKAKRNERIKYYSSVFILFLTVLSVLAAVGVSGFFIALSSHDADRAGNYTLEMSDYNTRKSVKGGYAILENGAEYVDFSSVAEYCGFAMVGSVDRVKYIVKSDTNETLGFDVGTDKAYVNGVAVRMNAASFIRNDNLFVPLEFVDKYARGIELTSEKDQLSVKKILQNQVDSNGKITDGKDPEYETVSFILKEPSVTASIPEDDSSVTMPLFTFLADLEDYESYMNPGSTTEFLTVVNKSHRLSEDYVPTGLSAFDSKGKTFYLKQYAAESLKALLKEASANGINGLSVSKAYIGYDELNKSYGALIDEYTPLLGEAQAKRYAETVSSVPGEDEHQTGLLVTFANASDDAAGVSTTLWLRENSYKFGFVERYPQNKSDITGHMFSSDDYRYVGRYHAIRMNALGMCLDEYSEYLGV